jgi:alpha-L-rhamnosidase
MSWLAPSNFLLSFRRLHDFSTGALVNGKSVGDHVLAPGWTSYASRLRYQTFDVTALLHEGPNAIGAMLGDGWYRSELNGGIAGLKRIYGSQIALLAQLELIYADNTREIVGTDEDWKTTPGPILASDLYQGERYDARLERAGWSTAGYDDSDWDGVSLLDHDLTTLVAPSGPPVRRTQELVPVAITASPSGKTLVDFGQNFAGRVRFTVRGAAGQTITLRHAELLVDGELYTRPLGLAKATDTYIVRGEGQETWEPRFTFHGFRYVEVTGWPGDLRSENLRGIVCHSDLERIGWFECSDPLVNRLHENVIWGMRSNFLDVPTDCPQRAERLGWTGDIQVFAPTASFLYDTTGFLSSWLADLAAEQQALGGRVPDVVPFTLQGTLDQAQAGWGDAAVIVPWALYQRFGDLGVLEAQFASMCAWVDFVAQTVGEERLWNKGFQYGDWLDPTAPPAQPEQARTGSDLVATAYFARSAELVSHIAHLLGKGAEAQKYHALAESVRAAFATAFLTPDGRVSYEAETAYALVLQFGLLVDPAQRKVAGKRLAELVRKAGYHISTGFLGTPLICDALCEAGYEAIAYRLLSQRECPSWLFPVTMGATTIWERWDALRPDGTPNPGQMLSYNHYAFGSIADWLHRTVAGLAPAEPGYRRLRLASRPGGGLTSASARHRTPYGLAAIAWQMVDDHLQVEATIPANTTATVALPGQERFEVGSGTYHWNIPFSAHHVTLDTPLGAILDDEAAWNAIVQTLIRVVPGFSNLDPALLRNAMKGYDEVPARFVLAQMPGSEYLLPLIEQALVELNQQAADKDMQQEHH